MDFNELIKLSHKNVLASIELIESSLAKYEKYDPQILYTPDDLEPYDALSDRFMRAVEIAIKYFKTWEYFNTGEKSDILGNTLNNAEKVGLISDTELWLKMRRLRNKIVHDYLPEEREETYNLIVNEYSPELLRLKERIEK